MRLLTSLLLLLPALVSAQQLAFPTAEGYGRFAEGGRGGVVYKVTNLNDSGVGSLRACMEATGARTCVFDVSGTIWLDTAIVVEGEKPYLTVAGQTAPDPGIQVVGAGFKISTNNVIMRHLRVRRAEGLPDFSSGWDNYDSIGLKTTCNNDLHGYPGYSQCFAARNPMNHTMIFDHMSFAWGSDEVGESSYVNDVTFQHSIIAEPFNNGRDYLSGGRAFLLEGDSQRVSFYRNMFSQGAGRNPQAPGGDQIDILNNSVVNCEQCINLGPEQAPITANIMYNHVTDGPNHVGITSSAVLLHGYNTGWNIDLGFLQQSSAYIIGNIDTRYRPTLGDPETASYYCFDSGVQAESWCPDRISPTPLNFDASIYPTMTTDPFQARLDVIANAGAQPLDTTDQRIVTEHTNNTGVTPGNVTNIPEGVVELAQNSRPAGYDTDDDGMPDAWELSYGLDPNDPSDRNGDTDGDGYTNLEEFLNGTDPGQAGLPSIPGWTLYWTDEFNVDASNPFAARAGDCAGTAVDAKGSANDCGSHWVPENEQRNNELQCYRDDENDSTNFEVSNGSLKLHVTKVDTPFTCPNPNCGIDGDCTNYQHWGAGIRTQQFEYIDNQYPPHLVGDDPSKGMPWGRVEVRAKVPGGKGTWPAAWMYGRAPDGNSDDPRGWPHNGELDVMEFVGHEVTEQGLNRTHHSYHKCNSNTHDNAGCGDWPSGRTGQGFVYNMGEDPTLNWHVYAMEWGKGFVKYYVDGNLVTTTSEVGEQPGFERNNPVWGTDTGQWQYWPSDLENPYGTQYMFILNSGWGGAWPGNDTDETLFGSAPTYPNKITYEVDYVRYYVPEGTEPPTAGVTVDAFGCTPSGTNYDCTLEW